jgi:hypothetical protein
LALAGRFPTGLRWLVPLAFAAAVSWWVLRATDGDLMSGLAVKALGCAARSLGVGAFVWLALAWIWRGSDPWSPRRSGAVLGAVVGCTSCAAVGIACLTEHAGHVVVGHWLAIPLLAALGALLARRVVAP